MNKRETWIAALSFVALVSGTLVTWAAVPGESTVPRLLEYDGTLEKDGIPVSGDWELRFQLVDDSGAALWPSEGSSDTWSERSVSISKGRFHQAFPASGDPELGDDVLDASSLRLRIGVREEGGSTWSDLSPDVELAAVPYALRAERAEEAGVAERAVEADYAGEAGNAGVADLARAVEEGGVELETEYVSETCVITTSLSPPYCIASPTCEAGWILIGGSARPGGCNWDHDYHSVQSYPNPDVANGWRCVFSTTSNACELDLTQVCYAICARLGFPS